MKKELKFINWVVVALLFGCDAPQLPDSGASAEASSASQSSDATDGETGEASSGTDTDRFNSRRAQSQVPDPGDVAPVTAEGREFTANDPVRGRRSRAVGGYAGAVFGANFWARHQIVIDQVKHALNLYWATNGEYPQSHDEFMKQIIEFNQIQLPELMEDQEYFYDPSQGQDGLLVRLKQSDQTTDNADARESENADASVENQIQ